MYCRTEGGYRYGHTNGDIPRDPVTFTTITNYQTGLFGATAEYIPHAGLDTSLASTSLIQLIPP